MRNLVITVVLAILVAMFGPGIYGHYFGTPVDDLAYNRLEQGAKKFKNPASIRVIEGRIYDSSFIARVSAENGLGGHDNGIYEFKKDGTVNQMDTSTGEVMMRCTGKDKVNPDVINRKVARKYGN